MTMQERRELEFQEKVILTQLKLWPVRKMLISKLKSGSKRIKSDPEVDARHKQLLENWKSLSKEQQEDFAIEIVNSENFREGYNKGEQHKEEIKNSMSRGWSNTKESLSRIVNNLANNPKDEKEIKTK